MSASDRIADSSRTSRHVRNAKSGNRQFRAMECLAREELSKRKLTSLLAQTPSP